MRRQALVLTPAASDGDSKHDCCVKVPIDSDRDHSIFRLSDDTDFILASRTTRIAQAPIVPTAGVCHRPSLPLTPSPC
jgi:hypothetical protein